MDSASVPDDLSPALDAVISRFAGMVRGVGWRHRLSEADVDEVMQQVRIRLWRAQRESEQISRVPASYVYRTAVSAALDLMRRRRAQRTDQTLSLDEPGAALPDRRNPEEDLAHSELSQLVARAIDQIPASRRPVVRMHWRVILGRKSPSSSAGPRPRPGTCSIEEWMTCANVSRSLGLDGK